MELQPWLAGQRGIGRSTLFRLRCYIEDQLYNWQAGRIVQVHVQSFTVARNEVISIPGGSKPPMSAAPCIQPQRFPLSMRETICMDKPLGSQLSVELLSIVMNGSECLMLKPMVNCADLLTARWTEVIDCYR